MTKSSDTRAAGGSEALVESPRVAVLLQLEPNARLQFEACFDDGHVAWVSASKWSDELERADIIFGNPPAHWIERMPALRWIQLESIGFDAYGVISSTLDARRIDVTNLRGMFEWPTAETALAGILALLRGIDDLISAGADQAWVSDAVRAHSGLLHRARVLVLGNGSIGARLRKMLEAFECEVQTFARSSPDAELHTLAELDAALPHNEIVVNCLPGTPATAGLFDEARFARFRPEAIFVNVGRGSVLDEFALEAALLAGRLGGAVLDVTEQEPLSRSSPLWSLPQVILTQHTGGGYRSEMDDKVTRFMDNYQRFAHQQPLMNRVDWCKGY